MSLVSLVCRLALLLGQGALPLSGLDAPDPQAAERALLELGKLGEEAALQALAELAEPAPRALTPVGRRLRARLVLEAGRERTLAGVLALLERGEQDPLVRRELLRFLGRAEHARLEEAPRAAALARAAEEDLDLSVRREALEQLALLSAREGVRALEELLARLPGPEKRLAAAALAKSPAARSRLLELVPAWMWGGTAGSLEALVELLPAYGRALAEEPRGGLLARERAPLVLGSRHPDPRLRVAAASGLDGLLARLRVLGARERLAKVLEELAEDGLEPALLSLERARLALLEGEMPERALEQLAGLEERLGTGREPSARHARARIAALEGVACLLLQHEQRGQRALARAASILDGLLAERPDLVSDAGRAEMIAWLEERALVELGRAAFALAADVPAQGLPSGAEEPELRTPARLGEALEAARRGHAFALEALARAEGADLRAAQRWDELVDSELSPRIALDGALALRRAPERALALLERFFRALASVAPDEMPGFEPWPVADGRLADPLADPERRELLERVLEARLAGVREGLRKAYRERFERLGDDPGGFDPAEIRRLLELEARRRDLDGELAAVRRGETEPLRELRFASFLALDHARALRDEGRPERARELARRMARDLQQSGLWERYFWRIELEAQVETLVGSTFMDEDEPLRAEEELERAVLRLEEYEKLLAERGAPLGAVRAARSNALVSLAVNANVKQGESEKARAYFERAWELRQDDFMKVLLACYKARDGEGEAARRLLREIRPSPASWYNLACTHALLGEPEAALEYLKQDFESERHTPATLARQRRWARRDPDLEALREDPRFQALVGADEGPERRPAQGSEEGAAPR